MSMVKVRVRDGWAVFDGETQQGAGDELEGPPTWLARSLSPVMTSTGMSPASRSRASASTASVRIS